MADDDSLRSDWQPPDWLTARPRPLVSQSQDAREMPPVPPVPDVPPEPVAVFVPPLPPAPGDVDRRRGLRARPEEPERPAEPEEPEDDEPFDLGPPTPDPLPPAEPAAEPEPVEPQPIPTATERADPDLTARLRAWERVNQDLYRLIGYEETNRLVFHDEGGNLLDAPGNGKLAGQLREAKFELRRIQGMDWRDWSVWWTAVVVAMLATGILALFDLPAFWVFVVTFLVSTAGRFRRRWRRRLDKIVQDHRLTYELVRERL